MAKKRPNPKDLSPAAFKDLIRGLFLKDGFSEQEAEEGFEKFRELMLESVKDRSGEGSQ